VTAAVVARTDRRGAEDLPPGEPVDQRRLADPRGAQEDQGAAPEEVGAEGIEAAGSDGGDGEDRHAR
jgi:hypothetical protein